MENQVPLAYSSHPCQKHPCAGADGASVVTGNVNEERALGFGNFLQFLCKSWHSKDAHVERGWIRLMSQGKERSSDEPGETSV